jgi:hypothetical protein
MMVPDLNHPTRAPRFQTNQWGQRKERISATTEAYPIDNKQESSPARDLTANNMGSTEAAV